MVDEVDKLESEKGAAMIRKEVDARLAEHDIRDAEVSAQSRGPVGPLVLTIRARGKSAEAEFSVAELQDSAHAIDHPAANKVRQLVSRFVL